METFEVVKVNLYNTLGQLATVMDDAQLDLLFKKFEDSRSRPLPDTLRLFELLRRLVASDTRVRARSSFPVLCPCATSVPGPSKSGSMACSQNPWLCLFALPCHLDICPLLASARSTYVTSHAMYGKRGPRSQCAQYTVPAL